MADILTISPTLHEQGLIAYECPSCGYITSALLPPDQQHR